MLLLQIAIGFWFVYELVKHFEVIKSWKILPWYSKVRAYSETLAIASFFLFIYGFVANMALGEYQLYELIMQLAQKVGTV